MKFKGIELKDNTEAELFIAIEIVNINNEEELKKYGKKLMKNIYNILNYDNCYPYIEFLDDNLPNVRCEEITFDKKGVELLTTIYNDIIEANLQNINVMIGVHIDGYEWFKREDGSEYNEDVVTLGEFLNNIEY